MPGLQTCSSARGSKPGQVTDHLFPSWLVVRESRGSVPVYKYIHRYTYMYIHVLICIYVSLMFYSTPCNHSVNQVGKSSDHQFGEPGLVSAQKLTNFYRTPSMST